MNNYFFRVPVVPVVFNNNTQESSNFISNDAVNEFFDDEFITSSLKITLSGKDFKKGIIDKNLTANLIGISSSIDRNWVNGIIFNASFLNPLSNEQLEALGAHLKNKLSGEIGTSISSENIAQINGYNSDDDECYLRVNLNPRSLITSNNYSLTDWNDDVSDHKTVKSFDSWLLERISNEFSLHAENDLKKVKRISF